MNAHKFLVALFEETTQKIADLEYKEEYRGSTGYFEKMLYIDLGLPTGTRFRFHTGPINDRRVVGIVTPVGNVIFFERYSGGDKGVVVMNLPVALSGLYQSGQVTLESIDQAMGGKDGYGVSVSEVVSRICNVATLRPIHSKVGFLIGQGIVTVGEAPAGDFDGDQPVVIKMHEGQPRNLGDVEIRHPTLVTAEELQDLCRETVTEEHEEGTCTTGYRYTDTYEDDKKS